MTKHSLWTPLHARLHRTLRSRHLLERNQRLLVAVSGGQDSLCLIKLLLDLQPKWGWQLGIAHCDHNWRSDSKANANYVEQLAETWETAFYCSVAEQSLISEAAARQWRYQALSAIAQENNYSRIITGHTASDRAETLLYNLMRGSGADGLQALTWRRSLNSWLVLVRPLLELTRTQTGQFCQEQQLKVWEDSTNKDFKYARNRIRHELLPYLQTHFNPQVEQSLTQTAELLQAEVEYLEQAAHELKQQAIQQVTSEEQAETMYRLPLRLNCHVLQIAPLALKRRVIRQLLQQVLSCRPSFEQIEKLTALITAPNGSRSDPFPGGAIAEVRDGWLCLNMVL